MRVLYLNPEHHDHLHATLIDGLSRISKLELITQWPSSNGDRGALCLHGDELGVRHIMSQANAVVFGTAGKYSDLPPLMISLIAGGKATQSRWILVDSGDLGSLPKFQIDWRRIDAVVKRELLVESVAISNLIRCLAARQTRSPIENSFRRHPLVPFPNTHGTVVARPPLLISHRRTRPLSRHITVRCEPIGIPLPRVMVPNPEPDRSVTCTLTGNVEGRRRLLRHVESDQRVTSRLVYPQPTQSSGQGHHEHGTLDDPYLRFIHAHRASISFPGGGLDTARFWEILATGALLISKRISLDLPVPLQDGVHYVGFDSLHELDDAIDFACSDSTEVDRIRAHGHALLLEHYTSRSIAERFAANELGLVSP